MNKISIFPQNIKHFISLTFLTCFNIHQLSLPELIQIAQLGIIHIYSYKTLYQIKYTSQQPFLIFDIRKSIIQFRYRSYSLNYKITVNFNQMLQVLDIDQKMNRIAIIGAGITGISVAFHHPAGSTITLFDKSRRPGGRVSTRTSRDHPGYTFDHGAPFVYAKGPFLELLTKIEAVKQVKIKYAQKFNQGEQKLIDKKMIQGNPQIETIPLKLIEHVKNNHKLTLQMNTRIQKIIKNQEKDKYFLESQQSKQYGPYDQVYVCIPYPQSKALSQKFVEFPQQQKNVNYLCCWVVMVAVDKNSNLSKAFNGTDVCRNVGENIESMVNQKIKGNKSNDDLYVFTMQEKWCQENMNLKPQNIQQIFTQKLSKALDGKIQFKYIKAHRWLYSKPLNTPSQPIKSKNIIFGADWINKCQNVQQCWDLGPVLYNLMNQTKQKL